MENFIAREYRKILLSSMSERRFLLIAMSGQVYYRAFISSVGLLLSEERRLVHDELWKNGFMPVAMEGFQASGGKRSIEVVMDYLDNCDFVVMILGYFYGSVIANFTRKECPLRKCDKCNGNAGKCVISYTHFEYLYSIEKEKLAFYIVNENYNNFDKVIELCKETRQDSKELGQKFNEQRGKNSEFINSVNKSFCYDYDGEQKLTTRIGAIIQFVTREAGSYKLRGLVERSFIDRKRTSIRYFIENDLMKMFVRDLLGSRPERSYADKYIRCVVVKYTSNKKKRFTVFELPRKESSQRKMRKRGEGVVGIMNDLKETIFYNFDMKKCYKAGRASAEKVRTKRSAGEAGDCMALLASPIKANGGLVGAVTFDFSKSNENWDISDMLKDEREINCLMEKSKKFAEALTSILTTSLEYDIDFMKIDHISELSQ